MQPTRTSTRIGAYVLHLRAWTDQQRDKKRKRFWHRSAKSLEALERQANGENTSDKQEALKDRQSAEEAVHKLEGMVEKAQNVLCRARAVWPLDFFPDTITIDRKKLTIEHRSFWGVKQTVSVRHSDVTNVQAHVGPFFGSLIITSEHFINNIQTIKYLPRVDVLKIQQLIQGMIIAHKEGVELNDIDDKRLLKLLNELGDSENTNRVTLM
jgi:hypothetical protein